MKTYNFLLMLAVCATLCVACDKNSEQLEVKMKFDVKAKSPSNSAQVSTVIFTGDEIVSYNGTTGEIVFANTPQGEVYEVLNNYNNGVLEFYLNGGLLFELKNRVGEHQSDVYNAPILRYGTENVDNGGGSSDGGGNNDNDTTAQRASESYRSPANAELKWFIEDGYPNGKTINSTNRGSSGWEQERNANAQAVAEGFNRFIEALKAEGKYIE